MRRPAPHSSKRSAAAVAVAVILAASSILASGVAPADPAATGPRAQTTAYYRWCGDVERYVSVGAHGLTCHKALAVAHAYVRGNHHPFGFRCKRVAVNAAAGYYTHCSKRPAAINIVPE